VRNISASVCCVLAVLLILALCANVSAQKREAYPWEMPLAEIGKFSALTYEAGGIKVTFTEGHCGPIIIKLPDESGTPVPKSCPTSRARPCRRSPGSRSWARAMSP